MLSIRIVSAGAVAAIAIVLAVGGATAQATTSDQAGKPLSLLAGLRPPHAARAMSHAKTAGRTVKKTARLRHKTANRFASRHHTKLAATQPEEPPIQTAAPPPANVWPVADAAAPTAADATPAADTTTATPQTVSPDQKLAPSALVVNGQTVQVTSPDQVNDIDLAAGDKGATAVDRPDAAPALHAVFAAPAHQDASAVGSASWIAQVLAALGGAAAAGTVAWFLIGGAPQRMYG